VFEVLHLLYVVVQVAHFVVESLHCLFQVLDLAVLGLAALLNFSQSVVEAEHLALLGVSSLFLQLDFSLKFLLKNLVFLLQFLPFAAKLFRLL
jgi:hypothetical protein